jgi:hypothetical protein
LRSAVRLGPRPALFAGIGGAFDRPHNNQNTLGGGSIMIDTVEKTTIRKIYVRLLPLLFVAYFIGYLDRINVGFAALTMNKDLGFTATVYALGATAFFWGYCLFECRQHHSRKSRRADVDRPHHDHLGPILRCYCFRHRRD